MTSPDALASLLAERTLEMVRIPSESGSESDLAGHVEGFLGERTAPDHLARHGNAVVARFGSGEPLVVLGGHLDTVPGNRNPEPAVEDLRVIGLGSTDMKGALAVMLTLAEHRRAAPRGGPRGSLGLVFYDCEEVAFERNGLRRLFDPEPWLDRADLAILMEPTDNAVELGCLGTLHARVTFHGVAAHSARPWTGRNAIHESGAFLSWLAGVPVQEVGTGDVVYREVLHATLAEGGTSRNVIPDRFTLNLNFRFASDRSPEEAEGYLRSVVPEGATVEITDRAPAAPPNRDAPQLSRLIEEHDLPARAKQAWTDVAQFAARGVPAANFGPGLPDLAHRRDEFVPVGNLVRSYRVLASFLGQAGSGGGEGT